MLRKRTFLKNHKSTMDNEMSEIKVFNMFKLLHECSIALLLCSKGIFWLDLNLLLTI